MDPIAANIQSILNAIQAASSAQSLPTLETPALSAMLGLGQEVEMLFQALTPEGVVLQLPSGQTLTAQGDLPYAQGTQLRVRIEPASAGETGLRIQVLEARPPAMPAILTPLVQGEAWALMARLQDAQGTPELEPLAQLLRLFSGADSSVETGSPAVANLGNQVALPSQAKLVADIQSWPAPLAQGLATLLGAADSSPADLATLVLNLFQEHAQGAPVQSPTSPAAAPSVNPSRLMSPATLPAEPTSSLEPSQILDNLQSFLAQHPEMPQEQQDALGTWMSQSLAKASGNDAELQRLQDLIQASGTSSAGLLEALNKREMAAPTASSTSPQAVAFQVLQYFQALVARHPELPQEQQDFLGDWLRQLLAKASANDAESPNRPTLAPREGQGAPPAPSQPSLAAASRANPPLGSAQASPNAPLQGLQALIQARGVPPAALPESWEAWVRGAVQTLADPQASPREAPFHALQGQERTGFFEVPLPWASQGPLQLWVEQDAQRGRGGSGDETRRVLLGLRFSRLGETRIGMEARSGSLRVRIWTEHPEGIQSESARLESELAELGTSVELRILPLVPGPDGTIPSLRAAATGSSLQAMG